MISKEKNKIKSANYRKNHKEDWEKLTAKYQYENARKFIGRRYGTCSILEISRVEKTKSRRNVYFLLTCKCGTRFEKRSDRLKGVTSCSLCLHIPDGKAAFSEVYGMYKKRSIAKYGEFPLSKDEFRKITKQPCFYCSAAPNNIYKKKKFPMPYIYNGIDRQDNLKGYTLENSVACCKYCNFAKRDLSLVDFYKWVNNLKNQYVKPQRINKKFPTRSIFFDVDDTLVIWPSKLKDKNIETVNFEFMGLSYPLVPHLKHIEELKKLYNEGYEIIVWSFGSKEWAKSVVSSLKIEEYVDYCLTKPDFYFDDLKVEEYLTEKMRIYYDPGLKNDIISIKKFGEEE
jgi:hypothetical protein